jgi:metal-responsive CopG/Arc/MetJ family transcriptional regulator
MDIAIISISLPRVMLRRLDTEAKIEGCNRSALIRRLVQTFFEYKDDERKKEAKR